MMESPGPTPTPATEPSPVPGPSHAPGGFARRTNPWLVFLLPFAVYMLVGSFEPMRPEPGQAKSASWFDLGIEYRHYPLIYSLKLTLTAAAMIYVLPGYRQISCRTALAPARSGGPAMITQSPPPRPTTGQHFLLALLIGAAGAVVWIALAWGQRYVRERIGWSPGVGQRPAFNPLVELADTPGWAYSFLAIRFAGLVLIVPVIEEFFLRGFLMRFFMAADWWTVPIGTANRTAIIAATVVPVLMHPGEAVAAAVWFSAVTWLLLRTRNLWPCVAAHAATNLLLGIYVVATSPDNWWLM